MTTMTQQAADKAWDDLIAEQSESAPGTYLQEGEVLSRGGSEDEPAPMRVSSLRYKGYVEVWDTETGAKSLQPWWLLWQTMRKMRENGKNVFTRTDPQIPPDYGEDWFCPLNPRAPEDQRFAGRGFRPCRKRHIPHWDGLQSHIQHSHSRAWAAMERAAATREREEGFRLQREVIASQNAMLTAITGRVTADPVRDEPAAKREKPKAAKGVPRGERCLQCYVVIKGRTAAERKASMLLHIRNVHSA